MDIYSSDLKLSELSMNLGPHISYHHQSLQHQSDSLSASSLASDSSPLYDNSSAYAIVDVLDFLETGLHESPKAYNSFNLDSNSDDNNQWLQFLNPPSEKVGGEVGALTFHDDDDNNGSSDFMAEDRLDFLDSEHKIKLEEHSYSLCNEGDDDDEDGGGMSEFKLHFDGDLELFQADAMEHDSFDSGKKLSVIGDLLLVDERGLSLGEQGPEDGTVPLLDTVSREDLDSASYDCGDDEGSPSLVARQTPSKKFGLVRSGLVEFCPPVRQIKTEPEELAQEELVFYGNIVDAGGLPPTPPSSGCGLNSDSECSNGGLSGPSSPPAAAREGRKQLDSGKQQHSTSLFSTPIPSSGILILSEEEKRTLLAEGYSLPTKLPLSKQEEKNLKKIRRKIKNKISAQESRRKKKEYLESLEKKVEQMSQENNSLKKRVTLLESNNRSLTSELQRLQGLANRVVKNVTKANSTSCQVK